MELFEPTIIEDVVIFMIRLMNVCKLWISDVKKLSSYYASLSMVLNMNFSVKDYTLSYKKIFYKDVKGGINSGLGMRIK